MPETQIAYAPAGTENFTPMTIFKMSIGKANNIEYARYFDEAIDKGFIMINWNNIDWTENRYQDIYEIQRACNEYHRGAREVNIGHGQVSHVNIFRNILNNGDLVVVSKGNHLFRAIGIVIGDYQYVPRENGRYCQKRKVKWLWVDRNGVSVERIYNRNFTMSTIYQLAKERLNHVELFNFIKDSSEEFRFRLEISN